MAELPKAVVSKAIPISVIIPVGPGEAEWKMLVASLELPKDSEVLLNIGEAGILY